jgi:hypothetical protein
MRKIERQMNTAISNLNDGEVWKNANTMVSVSNGVAFVFLHGNMIAEVGEGFIKLHDGGWQSNTTKSRLNAILEANGLPGERIFQEKFEWKVTLTDGTSIPFFSGMRLN